MNIDYSRGAYAKKDNLEENWWQRRSGLERKLIISCIIAILFAIGCLLYIVLGHSPIPQICATPTCLSAASEITSHMDQDADPCEDFYQFVCGKFSDVKHESIQAALKEQLKDNTLRQLQEIIEEPISDDDHDLVRNQKKLLQACMNETGADQSMDILQETFLDEIGGWPVVENFWRAKLFDWVETMYLLRNNGYPYSMMLNVGVLISVDDPTLNKVFITDPFVDKIADNHRDAYKHYMIEVAVAFGADRYRAEIQMPEVLEFMEELQKIEAKNEGNTTGPFDRNATTVKEYQKRHGDINWLEFLNNILDPIMSLSDDDYVVFPTDEYITAFFSLIGNTLQRVQAHYMIWSVLDQMIPYMSEELKQLKENYIFQTKKQSPIQDRAELCKAVINERPFQIVYARNYLPVEKREKVQQLFWNIKSEFMTFLMETSWMDQESIERATEKAEAIVGIIGAPSGYSNDTVFEDLEHGDDSEDSNEDYNGSWFSMYLNRRRHQSDFIYMMLGMTNDTSIFNIWITQIDVTYLSTVNIIVLPVGFIQEYFYDEDRPMYLNYATMGTVIGFKLAQGFFEDEDMWSNETAKALEDRTGCISNDEEFNFEDATNTTKNIPNIEQGIAEYTGIKIAYSAYKKWVEDNGEEAQLVGMEYMPHQIFWISAMSFNCFKTSEDGSTQNNSSGFRALQANGPFRNNPEFSNDFNCAVDTPMNPSEKCDIF